MSRHKPFPATILGCVFLFLCWLSTPSHANDSASLTGTLGLNVIPNARMDPVGTIRATYSHFGPYDHGSVGAQIADNLYLGFRQTADDEQDTHLFPGMDLKFRLFNEKRFRPEISFGMQSVLGHKRMAGEYLALSKRYENFDFTFGAGWGRMGTRQTIANPMLFKNFSSSHRSLDGESPNSPKDWFSGRAGLFAGLQYDVPAVRGFSFKTDWSSDDWNAERHAYSEFDAPPPWSIGISYRPYDWIDAGFAMSGLNHMMLRLSFSPNLKDWVPRAAETPAFVEMISGRPDEMPLQHHSNEETSEQLGLRHVDFSNLRADADLEISPTLPAAFQIGQGARHLSNISGKNPEQLSFSLMHYGLRGPNLTLNRRDLEQASLTHQGSAEEIWHNTLIDDQIERAMPPALKRAKEKFKQSFGFKVDWVSDFSLAEDDAGILYRTALVPSLTKRIGKHFTTEHAVRFNLADNLQQLSQYRGVSLYPVRSDISVFTQNGILVDRQYLAGFATLAKDVHVSASIGYLEEMYAGITGEILYRPFDKPWAIGLDLNQSMKRDPYAIWGLASNGDHILSGFVNGYYEVPNTGATFKASAGRYLAGDVGGSLALDNEFDNGVKAGAFIVATNRSDFDLYGGKTNLYAGMTISMPLGSLPLIPDGSRMISHTKPLGRDTAQRLDNPVSLYEVTEPISYRSITRHWSALTHRP